MDEITPGLEKCAEFHINKVIEKKVAECAGLKVLTEDTYYYPEVRECYEKVEKEVYKQ